MTQPQLFATPHTPTSMPKTTTPYGWLKPVGGRTARPDRCRHCKAPILRGLDENLCAFQIAVDPAPLAAIGEVLALLDGRSTVTAHRDRSNIILTRRNQWAISRHPAGQPDRVQPYDVLAEHHCGSPPLPAIDSALTGRIPLPYDDSPDAPPPF